MNLDIDSGIFIGFLLINLIVGLLSSRRISTINEYAIGDRNFSTATIVATIIATWVSGNYIFLGIVEAYTNGLNFIWVAALGDFLCLLSVGVFFAPRMGEFLGKLSIADAMGSLYGDKVRIVTAISGFIGICGIIAMQFKIAGLIFEYALGMPNIYGVLSAAIIVTLYSALGGIKSVTFTDVIQFITFGTVIPAMAYVLFSSLENVNVITDTLTNNPLFDYKKTFDFSNSQSFFYLFIFLFFAIPAFNPAIFQRVAMAKNVKQVSSSFIVAAVVCLLLVLIVSWIGVLMLAIHPNIESNDIVKRFISDYSFIIGYKGVVLAGVMAMIMSTVDSYINSTAVIVVHDFFKPLKIKFIKNELFSARIMSVLIGILSLILSLRDNSLLELIIVTYSLYMPIVTVPFIIAILGFRSTEKSVLLGMVAGLVTVLVWDYLLKIKTVNSVPLGMIANLIVLISSHYLLKQSGGWIGIKDKAPLIKARQERKMSLENLYRNIKAFSLINICKQNSPKADGFISLMGLFVMISAFSSVHTISKEFQAQYAYLLDVIYPISLCTSTALISYPLWLQNWKNSNLLAIVWNMTIFCVLVCFSFLMVLISHFSPLQLIAFMVNIIVISSLTKWKWALVNIIFGVSIVSFYCKNYIILGDVESGIVSTEFTIIYLFLLTSSSLLLFLKPKQDYQEFTEEKNLHLNDRLNFQEHELQEALDLKAEFLRNIPHEYHAPMTGVLSTAEVLYEFYDKLPEEKRKSAIESIFRSAVKLDCFDTNIRILSGISKGKLELNKEEIDLSNLVLTRIALCQKLYDEKPENHDFVLHIQENIKINGDKEHLTRTIDNLIINAIHYCPRGMIEIELKEENGKVLFRISDEGIGIPQDELRNIFDAFKVGSKTKTPAGGRGIGLTVAQKIIELHDGKIWAESDGKKGSTFAFTLPFVIRPN